MMLKIMEELQQVKQELQSKLNFKTTRGDSENLTTDQKSPVQVQGENDRLEKNENVLEKNQLKETEDFHGVPIHKSPSDTTIWAPAVAKDTSGAVNDRLRNDPVANLPDLNKYLDNYLTNIRLGTRENQQRREQEERQHIRRRLDFEEGTEPGEELATNLPRLTAREAAKQRVIEAEKYRADLEPPKGEKSNKSVFPICVEGSNAEFPGKPLLDDDSLMHLTCHVEDTFGQASEESQFVDFDKLLSKYMRSTNYDDSQKIEMVNKDGQIFYVPKEEKTVKITNIHMWEKAFRLYMAMYARKHPNKVGEMIQYMSTIQLAASKYTWENVAYYDNVFRHWMAKNPNRSWGKTLGQMWNIALCDPLSINRGQGGNYKQGGGKNQTRGICWRFNKGICNAGDKCRYPHKCTYCGGTSHGAHVCFKKARKSETRSNGQSSSNNSTSGSNASTVTQETKNETKKNQ